MEAITLPRSAIDPQTVESAVAKFGGTLKQGLQCGQHGVEAMFANSGELFLTAKEDCIASHLEPLCQLGKGSWLDGKALTDFVAKAKQGHHIL